MRRAVHHSAVWLVLPLWVLFVGISLGRVALLIHYDHDFIAHARHTQGVVLARWSHPIDHFSSARIYVLIYSYEAENVSGRVRTGVDHATFDRVHVGGPIPIAYLPSDPRVNCIDYPWELSDMAWVPLDDFVVAMMVFIPAVFLTWHFGMRNRIHDRLKTTGVPTWGEVTSLEKTHHRAHSDTYLVFRFTTPSGRLIVGRSPSVTANDRTNWKVGDPVSILYDPKNPAYFSVDIRHTLDGVFADEPPTPDYNTLWA
jgi:hypothetical protein